MQSNRNNHHHILSKLLEKNWVCYTLAGCIMGAVFVLFSHLGNVLSWLKGFYQIISPIVIGLAIAYLLNPLVNYCEKKVMYRIKNEKMRHVLSVVLMLIVVTLLVTLLLIALLPSVWNSIMTIIKNMDGYMVTLQQYMEEIGAVAGRFHIDMGNIATLLNTGITKGMEKLSQNMDKVMEISTGIGSGILNLFLGIILAIYFLMGKKSIMTGVRRLRHAIYTDKVYAGRTDFWKRCHNIFIQYIGYDLLDGMIIGIVNAVFMLIMGMPYVTLISVIVGVTNLLPTFGPIIGAVIAGIIIVLDSPQQALIFLIFTMVLQTIDGYVLKPRLFSGSLGVPAVWVLVSIILGGKIFGVIGILLGIPCAAIFTIVYEEQIMPWLLRKKKEKEKQEKDPISENN